MIHSVSPATARAWLRSFAVEVANAVSRRSLPIFKPRSPITVAVSHYTDGWCAEIGDIHVNQAQQVSAFFDLAPTPDEYRPWIGFFVAGGERTKAIGERLARHVGMPFTLPDSAFYTRRGKIFMRARLQAGRYDRPLIELYDNGLKSVGMYPSGLIDPFKKPSRAIVRASAEFLSEALAALEGWVYSRTRVPEEVTNVEGTVSGKAFRRNPKQAAESKRRDKYSCRICGDRPEEKYGVDGRSCLEAHHVYALHTRRRTTTRLADLITVCANCHSVLGSLPPDRRGFRELRARVRAV